MILLAVWLPAAHAMGQSPLAEVARKEAERRKATPPAAKVYTEKDLPSSAKKAPASQPSEVPLPADQAPPAAAAPVQPAPADKPQPEQRDEAWWRARMQQEREELRRNEMFAEALQSRINALTREYALPLGGAKRIAVGQQRAEALNELSRVKDDIARGRKRILEIEEEARQAGVPPGWLR